MIIEYYYFLVECRSLLRIAKILFLFSFSSCSQSSKYEKPIIEPTAILKDFDTFLRYKQKYLHFYESYKTFDSQGRSISKDIFFRSLLTGKFLPLRLKSTDSIDIYKLITLKEDIHPNFRLAISQLASYEYDHYKLEGKLLPNFQFIDMNGNSYNRASTKGKILVIKCWFVSCLPCVQEMPALNAIKKRYKDREDIIFLSLCLDPRDKISSFLKNHKFDYAIIPNQGHYIEQVLKVRLYPTHFVINKKGYIVKQIDNVEGVNYTLKSGRL